MNSDLKAYRELLETIKPVAEGESLYSYGENAVTSLTVFGKRIAAALDVTNANKWDGKVQELLKKAIDSISAISSQEITGAEVIMGASTRVDKLKTALEKYISAEESVIGLEYAYNASKNAEEPDEDKIESARYRLSKGRKAAEQLKSCVEQIKNNVKAYFDYDFENHKMSLNYKENLNLDDLLSKETLDILDLGLEEYNKPEVQFELNKEQIIQEVASNITGVITKAITDVTGGGETTGTQEPSSETSNGDNGGATSSNGTTVTEKPTEQSSETDKGDNENSEPTSEQSSETSEGNNENSEPTSEQSSETSEGNNENSEPTSEQSSDQSPGKTGTQTDKGKQLKPKDSIQEPNCEPPLDYFGDTILNTINNKIEPEHIYENIENVMIKPFDLRSGYDENGNKIYFRVDETGDNYIITDATGNVIKNIDSVTFENEYYKNIINNPVEAETIKQAVKTINDYENGNIDNASVASCSNADELLQGASKSNIVRVEPHSSISIDGSNSNDISNNEDKPVYYIKRDDGWFYQYDPENRELYNSSFTIDTKNNKLVDDGSNG